jgi:hypothetical protein
VTVIATSWLEIALPLGIPALTGVVAWWANGARSERTRLQKLYADAFSAVVSYQEFPYVIRRRRAPLAGQESIPNEERLRISEALQAVQEELNNYRAQISTESSAISAKYEALVGKTRQIAGKEMHEAWEAPPLDNDAGMNITHIDYSQLEGPEKQYQDAVKEHVTFGRIFFSVVRPK